MDGDARGPDWAAIREAYEGRGETIPQIAERHGLKPWAVSRRARLDGWLGRNTMRKVDRARIIGRMFGLLDRQLVQVENGMKDAGDKEVALLGNMARTLEKLIALETAEQPKDERGGARDMKALRRSLADRIDRLKRG
ncbi:hypothetical protein EMQ25_09010 [Arsenicitalea aurantiaca]|uniref:Terminase n=1 Tax=Arsenicitalea aurantiaca TaxID=1783274 RepID=A0A433XAF5_9HYPH|nr:hypothetical protein [Arsenicitalea aurantiaca]RUT31008.1 hypothetical protein EMQ25_09010 [Arsenicitalea aurantiaca]